MTEEELSLYISKYLISNWETLLLGVFSVLGTIVCSTWLLARYWYQRELKYTNDIKEANEAFTNKQIAHMTKQIEYKESYAKGVIEVMKHRLLAAEEEPKRLLHIIRQNEKQLSFYKNKIIEAKKKLEETSMGKEPREVFLSESFSGKEKIQEILNDIFDYDPDDKGVSMVKNEFFYFENKDWNDPTNLSAMLGLMSLLLQFQREKIVSLNLDISHNCLEPSISYINFCKAIREIIAPISSSKTGNYREVLQRTLENKNHTNFVKKFQEEVKHLVKVNSSSEPNKTHNK